VSRGLGDVYKRQPLEMTRRLLIAIDQWRSAFPESPHGDTPLLRRIWKGGRIAKEGLSPDGVWLTVHQAASHAGLGQVTPDDLRRSVAAQVYDDTHSIEEVSKLLRHRNLIVTERFLARIGRSAQPASKKSPQTPENEGL